MFFFFFSSRRRHTRYWRDWSSDVCSSDLDRLARNQQLDRVDGRVPRGVDEILSLRDEESELVAPAAVRELADELQLVEIGRAACRGRGLISVVAGFLKKKKR